MHIMPSKLVGRGHSSFTCKGHWFLSFEVLAIAKRYLFPSLHLLHVSLPEYTVLLIEADKVLDFRFILLCCF